MKVWRVSRRLVPFAALFLLALLTMVVNREWFYNPIGYVDPAVYLGWFLHPITYRHLFAAAPSGDLLPLILPNAAFYAVLPAVAANFVIKLLCFFTAIACLFVIVREFFGVRAASICVIAFAFYRYTLVSFGSEYTDGRVGLHFLLALAFAVCASRPTLSRLKILLLLGLSGAFAQMMVSTCLLAVVLLPVIFGAALVVGPSLPIGIPKFKMMFRQAGAAALGFVTTFVILCWMDKALYGGDGFYLRNSLHKAASFVGQNRVYSTLWMEHGGWFLLPLLIAPVAFGNLLLLIFKNRPDRRRMQLIALLVTAPLPYVAFIILQLGFKQETLSNPIYFDFLTPLTFLLVGAAIFRPLSLLSSRDVVITSSGLLFVSVLMLIHSRTHFFAIQQYQHAWQQHAHSLQRWVHIGKPLYGIAAFAFLILYLLLATRTGRIGAIMAVLVVLTVPNFICTSPDWERLFVRQGCKANFVAVVRWVQLCDVLDPRRQAVVWYDVNEPTGFAYMEMASASHLWSEYGVLNEQFPNVTDERIRTRLAASPTRTLLLLSQKVDAPVILRKRLELLGLAPRLIEQHQVAWRNQTFQVFVFTL